jgi:hypothetical protein
VGVPLLLLIAWVDGLPLLNVAYAWGGIFALCIFGDVVTSIDRGSK